MLTVCGLSIKVRWDSGAVIVCTIPCRCQVVLSPVLFLASFEDNQSLFTVTYIVWAVWMLAFDRDIRLWRSSLWRLRLYNLFVLALQVMYQVRSCLVYHAIRIATYFSAQIPDIPAPSDCQAYSDCFTWQTIIGFEKYRSVIVTGAPSCVTSSSPDTGSNSDCSYAFSVTYGLAVQVIIFGLLAFQNRVLCSSTFQTLISQHDLRTKLSHWRSIRASRLWEVREPCTLWKM